MKRILALLLCICIMASAVPAAAAADGAPEIVEGVYQIGTADELAWLASHTDANAVLTNDVDLSGYSWSPIGNSARYTGTFDGAGHTIQGLSGDNGLFGSTGAGAEIRNLVLTVDISGTSTLGGLVGNASSTIIENVSVYGTVSGASTGKYVGGLAGSMSSCIVSDCVNHALVTGGTAVGGLVGYYGSHNEIYRCANTGAVTAVSSLTASSPYSSAAGGLIGYLASANGTDYGEVAYCYNTGAVSGECVYLGGLFGCVYGNAVMVHNCYNTGTVSSTRTEETYPAHVGGITGCTAIYGAARYAFNYNAGAVSAAGDGALVGGFGGTVTSVMDTRYNYWLSTTADSAVGNDLSLSASTEQINSFTHSTNLAEKLSGVYVVFGGEIYYNYLVDDKYEVNSGLPVLAWQICGREHSYEADVVAPTCTENGYTVYSCVNCGHVYQGDEIVALGHAWDEGQTLVPATCYAEGTILYTCTRGSCGATETKSIDKLEHVYDGGIVTPPTCVEQGYTTYTCTTPGCGDFYQADFTDALGHTYEETDRIFPTCTQEGSITYTCTVCSEETEGHTYTEPIPATGHNFVDGVCINEGCEETIGNVYYWLKLQLLPLEISELAKVTVTDRNGETVEPDTETGCYLLDRTAEYQYHITAEHYLEENDVLQGIDEGWAMDETDSDGIICYIMSVTLRPDCNLVSFQGSNVTVTVKDEVVTNVEVAYEKDLEFQLSVPENYWISKITAMTEAPTQCDDTWTGTVSTGFGGGTGAEEDPYLIQTCAQLAFLAQEVNYGETFEGAYFQLDADLDLAGLPWNPIGISTLKIDYTFCGNFDGNGHVIRNLNVASTVSGLPGGGLFGTLSGAQVKNLGLPRCTIDAAYRAGGLAAMLTDGSVVENCWVTGKISVEKNYAGGLVGIVNKDSSILLSWNGADVICSAGSGVGGVAGYAYNATISDCWNIGNVTGSGSTGRVGGVVGYLYKSTTLKNCYNSGSIIFSGTFSSADESGSIYGTGGVVGVMVSLAATDTILQSCYNDGVITASTGRAGGIAGNAVSRSGTGYTELSGCYNTGAVIMLSSSGFAGGLTGRAYGDTEASLVIKNCYNAGSVRGTLSGALVCYARNTTLENCYALQMTADVLVGSASGTDVSDNAFRAADDMQTGDFIVLLGSDAEFRDDVYNINSGYPVLLWQADRPDIYGEYQKVEVHYDEENGTYTIPQVIQPVTVRVDARALVSEKRITFDVQPSSQVFQTLDIVVLDSQGMQIQPEEGTVNVFTLLVGESYSYRIQAQDFETVEGILEVTDSTGYLISVRMQEGVPTYAVNFELNSRHATIYSSRNDSELSGSVRVTDGSSLGFYVIPDSGYELVSVYLPGSETLLDVWDGQSEDTSWYSENLKEYTITTAAELAGVSRLVRNGTTDFSGVTLHLDADLDLTAGNFIPIGTSGIAFQGTFNGGGHTITAVIAKSDISSTSAYGQNYRGLFGYVKNAVVEDLTIAGSVQGKSYVGGVVGMAEQSTIRNCSNLAEITASGSTAGGIAGCSSGSILNCYNGGDVTGPGGIAGIVASASLIRGCHNDGTIRAIVSANSTGAGGICCGGNTIVESCSNSGAIFSAGTSNGGISCYGVSQMTNCYNTGNIYCTKTFGNSFWDTNYIGGITGAGYYTAIMENCYNTGGIYFIGGGSGATGSIVGSMTIGALTGYLNIYWLTGTGDAAVYGGGTSIKYSDRQFKEVTADELKELYTALGDEYWKKDVTLQNNGFPVLRDAPDLSVFCKLENLGDGEYRIPAVTRNATVYITLAKKLDALSLSMETLELAQGGSYTLTASLEGEDADLWSVSWSSSDVSVASVSESGVVTAIGAGTAVITAKAGSASAACTVTVPAPDTYEVIFSGGEDAEGDAPQVNAQSEGAVFLLPENTFVKAGCEFCGWSDGASVYEAGAEYIMPACDVTFTAVWTVSAAIDYRVTENTVSDDLRIDYISGAADGIVTDKTIIFRITVKENLSYTPVVFYSIGGEPARQIFPQTDGSYTLEDIDGDVQITAYILGDVTGDGLVNSADALYLLQQGGESSDPVLFACADVTGDGILNAADALKILSLPSN